VRSSIARASGENFRDAWAIVSERVDSLRMDDISAEERLKRCEKAIEEIQQALQIPPTATVGGKNNQLAELLVVTRKNEEAIGRVDSYINSEVRGRLARLAQDVRSLKPSY
jgi:hypothetical protein